MKKITAGQVHKALVDSIELRWKPLSEGVDYDLVPSCQLCTVVEDRHVIYDYQRCVKCPLYMIGQGCGSSGSAWRKWREAECSLFPDRPKKEAADNMIKQLQKCLDTFFPTGLEK